MAVQSHSGMRVDPSRQARPLPKNMQMSGGPSYNKLAHRVPAGHASDKTSAKCTGCHLHCPFRESSAEWGTMN